MFMNCRMSSVASATVEVTTDNLKRKSEDIGWEYGVLVDPNNMDKVKCKLCNKIVSGGVYRIKQHIAHIRGNVAKCPLSTKEDQERCIKSIEDAQLKKKSRKEKEQEVRNEVTIDENVTGEGDGDGDLELENVGCSARRKLGPMDKFAMPIDPSTLSSKELRQQAISATIWKERLHKVRQYVARWIYESGIHLQLL